MHLGVTLLEGHIRDAVARRGGCGPLEHGSRQVQTDGSATARSLGGETGGLAVAAADVEHGVGLRDGGRAEQVLGERTAHGVVAVLVGSPVLALLAVPRLGLLGIGNGMLGHAFIISTLVPPCGVGQGRWARNAFSRRQPLP